MRPSFVPERPLSELRDLVRYRKAKIQERSREVQRVEKTLQDAGIKLSSVASEVLGVSARKMLDALISGTHDPEILAELAKGALRKKIPALREALQGRFTGHHALLIGQMLAQIDFLDETIATLSERIEELTRPFSRELELLDTIPGVDKRAAEMLLAEIGPDMSRFPTDAHLASWAGMCPGQRESAGKKHSGRHPQRLQMAARNPDRICQGESSAPRAPTCLPATTASRAAAGTPRPRSPPATRSSSPPTTSSNRASPTTNSAKSSSTAATPRTPNATADDSCTTRTPRPQSHPRTPPRRPPDRKRYRSPNATGG